VREDHVPQSSPAATSHRFGQRETDRRWHLPTGRFDQVRPARRACWWGDAITRTRAMAATGTSARMGWCTRFAGRVGIVAPDRVSTAPPGRGTWRDRRRAAVGRSQGRGGERGHLDAASRCVLDRPQLLQALEDLPGMYGDLTRAWNWWQQGRREQERARVWQVLSEWDNDAPDPGVSEQEAEAYGHAAVARVAREVEEDRRRRADLVADQFDQEREYLRLRLLQARSDAAFFGQVLKAPASAAQQADAERRLAESQAAAAVMRDRLGDPEQVVDQAGYLPAQRREVNLRWHMEHWRHPTLRAWATSDRRRFTALLRMPMPEPAAMCAECQAPAAWHDYDISLRLFHPAPAPGSEAATTAALVPGWWERCPACTIYRIGHRWGRSLALPDLDGAQWRALLPPRLRAVFAPAPSRPRPKPLAVIPAGPISEVLARLAEAQQRYPDARVRRGAADGWELWPASQGNRSP
jgi:hypothetical protein